jgi:hypothetical protein
MDLDLSDHKHSITDSPLKLNIFEGDLAISLSETYLVSHSLLESQHLLRTLFQFKKWVILHAY